MALDGAMSQCASKQTNASGSPADSLIPSTVAADMLWSPPIMTGISDSCAAENAARFADLRYRVRVTETSIGTPPRSPMS